jgi:quinolinate synthase
LDPDPDAVEALRQGLLKTNIGIVAHFYMDVELQGILQALKNSDPKLESRVGIADSLKMGELAVDMCQNQGVESVICLGVDFMAESVQAILKKNDVHVPVYRASAKAIGCSLAESAEGDAYRAWLQKESSATDDPSLHVIYINTSLETKAITSSIVPTITCTSSNVLQTLLQASHEIPNLNILYGPDTYMGENLQRLFETVLEHGWSDEKIKAELHHGHTQESIKALRKNLKVFPHGNCIVHHMFGSQVVQTVKEQYDDCFMTAHLEVPGEMFDIAMEKSLEDKGVVGSTSDILGFISRKVQESAKADKEERLRFVLGTEAGMVTSIVQSVQNILQQTGNRSEAEIIFPVSSDAVMSTDGDNADFAVVPGVSGGEGCSTAGGCATCPFMKMNSLDALQDIVDMVDSGDGRLKAHLPPDRLSGKQIDGIDAMDLGSEAILYMRHLMNTKELPENLVKHIVSKER